MRNEKQHKKSSPENGYDQTAELRRFYTGGMETK
jgi:hypothetical protein